MFKLNLPEEHFQTGHQVAQLFADAGAAYSRNPGDIVAVVRRDKIVEFVDDSFEAKLNVLAKHGRFGFSTVDVNGRRPGFLYFEIDSPEYVLDVQNVQNVVQESVQNCTESKSEQCSEMLEESISKDEVDVQIINEYITELANSVVANDLTVEKDVDYFVHDYDEVSEDCVIYRNKQAIFEENEKEIVGHFDGIRGVVRITNDKIVERIQRAVDAAIGYEIGVSSMAKRDGLYFDFISPDYVILKLEEIEIGSEYDDVPEADRPTQLFAHFFADEKEEDIKARKPIEETVQDVQNCTESKSEQEIDVQNLKNCTADDIKKLAQQLQKSSKERHIDATMQAYLQASLGNSRSVERVSFDHAGSTETVTESTRLNKDITASNNNPNNPNNPVGMYLKAARYFS